MTKLVRTILAGFLLAVAGLSTQAAMLGDPITSVLHTLAAGSWTEGESAIVGPEVEFMNTNYLERGFVVTSLDLADTSFTFRFANSVTPVPQNDGSFNLGLLGFEFTNPNQRFLGVSLAGTTGGFPVELITNTVVTPTTVRIYLDSPIIPGATTWSATWNLVLAPRLDIERLGASVRLSWPADASGYVLQQQSGLRTNGWTTLVTSTNSLTLPATNAPRFFRLLKN